MDTVRTNLGRMLGGRALLLASTLGVGVALIAGGCKKKQPEAAAPTATVTYPAATAPATAATAAPTTTAAPTAATSFDEGTKAALGAAIDARAPKEAAAMKPVGELFGGELVAGGQVESPMFMVEQARCYTILAQGGIGVTELDVKLLGGVGLVPAGLEPTLAVDNTTGPAAAITPCWKPMLGGPAKVVLTARGGAGPAAARIYAK